MTRTFVSANQKQTRHQDFISAKTDDNLTKTTSPPSPHFSHGIRKADGMTGPGPRRRGASRREGTPAREGATGGGSRWGWGSGHWRGWVGARTEGDAVALTGYPPPISWAKVGFSQTGAGATSRGGPNRPREGGNDSPCEGCIKKREPRTS